MSNDLFRLNLKEFHQRILPLGGKRLIEECILNAYIVYTETPGTTRMRLLKFRVELVKALLREGGAGNAIHHLEAVTDRLQGRQKYC